MRWRLQESDLIISLDEEEAAGSDSDEPPNIEQELDQFRQQWQQELQRSKNQGNSLSEIGRTQFACSEEEPSVEEQAKHLFMLGVNAEENGQLYEAIQYYRRAVQLVPDIEFRIEEFKRPRRVRKESESSVESVGATEEEDEGDDLDDLFYRFHRLKVRQGSICTPQNDSKSTHISALPIEVLMYLFKWVVSSELDTLSLERLAEVSRGFYLCARDEELWRLICYKVWGANCGRPSAYGSWRNMYIQRPHLRFNGCYISKMTYYRQGERGLDNFYKPYHLVQYFRFVRFFPEGQILMLTTPEDPYATVSKLRSRNCRVQGVLQGYYKMAGDQVTAVLKRKKVADYNLGTSSYYRYKRQRQQNQNDGEQSFHVEFQLKNSGKRAHAQLIWNHYAIHTLYKSTGQENIADFELNNTNYPPLIFSRVKSYSASSDAPLE